MAGQVAGEKLSTKQRERANLLQPSIILRDRRFDALFAPPLSWNFAVEVRRPSVAGSIFRLRFGGLGERGRKQVRRSRDGKLNSLRLGSPVNTGSLSPVRQAGGALSGMRTRGRSAWTFLPVRSPPITWS